MSPKSPVKHAGSRAPTARDHDRGAQDKGRRTQQDRENWTWGAAGIAVEGDTTVEVDEAIEAEAWKLSIDTPVCYVSVQIDGRKELDELLTFLRRADQDHPLGQFGELNIGPPWITWVWDDETSGRLFIWLNRASKHSMRVQLGQQQVNCIRSALAEATKTG
jgi:hypothetical protein